MSDYEKLGVFYLGKQYDLIAGKVLPEPLLYESKDLTTHAVCVGMTGSGKTGLCLDLLEEAAIDGIPAIAIDPKGDLGNLLLTFPELKPADFQPWIDPGEALRKGMQVGELAAQTAASWKAGLAEWDQTPERIAKFRDAVDIAIYTPGSSIGLPLSVLKSFAVPSAAVLANAEALRERVQGAAAGLLCLLGIDADPLQSREHILLANILDSSWKNAEQLDLPGLIRKIQSPGFDRVGVLDLESFFPSADRFALAMRLNNLLASPGFSAWLEGDAIDIQRLLYTAAGKPRLSIISIAHLSDQERMFFVTILLNEVLSWMRSQSGTTSLRALLYMDEVFGYFPPVANPPSKQPMLTLLKQARAFGLGVVLATQNPVDLDYKGLSNAGTWLLGRLQTARDKARVLDGLEGAATAAGAGFDRGQMEQLLSSLGKRVFLLNNVHEDQPVVFQSRWALSYLRGPLNREQIGQLMAPRKAGAASSTAPGAAGAPVAVADVSQVTSTTRPLLPPGIPEFFVPRRGSLGPGETLVYKPTLVASARAHFSQAAAGIDHWETLTLTTPVEEELPADVWADADCSTETAAEFESTPDGKGTFAALPAGLMRPKTYASLGTSCKDFLYRTRRLSIFKCAALKQTSRAGETEADFRVRLSQAGREQRDLQVEKLRAKYAPKLATVNEQIRKAEQRVAKEQAQARDSTFTAAISMGSSILGAVFGRKLMSSANVSRAATGMRAATKVARENQDVGQAQESVAALQEKLAALEVQFQTETAQFAALADGNQLDLETVELLPKKSELTIERVALVWTPWKLAANGKCSLLV